MRKKGRNVFSHNYVMLCGPVHAFIFLEFLVFCLLLVLDVWRDKEMRLSVSNEWDVQSAAYYSNESCEVAVLSVDVFIYLFICKIAAPIGSTRTPRLLFLEALFSFFTRLHRYGENPKNVIFVPEILKI